MDFPNFITWFKNSNNTFNTFNYATKEFKTVLILEYKINQFELFKGYETDSDGLVQFSDDLIKWKMKSSMNLISITFVINFVKITRFTIVHIVTISFVLLKCIN